MISARTQRPILLGVLIAPLGAPVALLLYALASVVLREGIAGLSDWPAGVVIYFAFGLPIAYGATLVLGLPYLSWLKHSNRLSWISVCAGAIVVGAAAFPIGLVLLGANSQPYLSNSISGGLAGLACGALFCFVTGPNNSFKPNPHRGGA